MRKYKTSPSHSRDGLVLLSVDHGRSYLAFDIISHIKLVTADYQVGVSITAGRRDTRRTRSIVRIGNCIFAG